MVQEEDGGDEVVIEEVRVETVDVEALEAETEAGVVSTKGEEEEATNRGTAMVHLEEEEEATTEENRTILQVAGEEASMTVATMTGALRTEAPGATAVEGEATTTGEVTSEMETEDTVGGGGKTVGAGRCSGRPRLNQLLNGQN